MSASTSDTEDYTIVPPSLEGPPPSDPSTPSTAALADDPFMNPNPDAVRDVNFYRLTDYVEITVSLVPHIDGRKYLADLDYQVDNSLFRIDSHIFERESDSARLFVRQATQHGAHLDFEAVDFIRFLRIAECR
jgi:hypothetical protein